MPEMEFSAHVRIDTGVPVIDLVGDVSAFAEPSLNAAFAEATRTGSSGQVV